MMKKKTPIRKNKNLIIILLSSILIIGISLGFILTRQESKPKIDVSMWSTYKNVVYNFEFRYPSPWVLVPYQHGRVTLEDVWLINKPDYILDIDKYSFIKNDFSSIFVSMTKFGVEVALGSKNVVYSKNTDLKEYVIERTGAPDSEIEKYKLDNKSGYMRTYKFGDRLDRQVFVKTTDGILTLGYREGQNDFNSTVKSDFVDMLSTFKFTN